MEGNFFKVGDKVRHIQTGEIGVVTSARTWESKIFGLVDVYCVDFGHSVKGSFGIEYNNSEFISFALQAV